MFTKVFSFDGAETDTVRESYDAHTIKIIDIQENGDCTFIVKGYMNRASTRGRQAYLCADIRMLTMMLQKGSLYHLQFHIIFFRRMWAVWHMYHQINFIFL